MDPLCPIKNIQHKKGLVEWLEVDACLASVRPWVQNPNTRGLGGGVETHLPHQHTQISRFHLQIAVKERPLKRSWLANTLNFINHLLWPSTFVLAFCYSNKISKMTEINEGRGWF
jgi:hypothetical protein